ncbi:hypothetical protein GCM10009836_32010 [Pseudonocardia ailaonensis]|uniref:Uncharacterized protein n=1 Tax=Pseudonocardia ailaonensis TaxID=367279 RepID=A0ABN2N2K7_9PSEU
MDELLERALAADVTAAAAATALAAVREAERHADVLIGVPPLPGTSAWEDEQGTDLPDRRERAWQVAQLRIELEAGVDPLPTLVGLRRTGATWDLLGRAAGISRQSAHERWAKRIAAVLDEDEQAELGPRAGEAPGPTRPGAASGKVDARDAPLLPNL